MSEPSPNHDAALSRQDEVRDALGQYLKASASPHRWSLTVEDAKRAVRARAAFESLMAEFERLLPTTDEIAGILSDV